MATRTAPASKKTTTRAATSPKTRRTPARAAAKPASPPPVVEKAAKPSNGAEGGKRTKAKLVRDSFTIPDAEYAAIDELKRRAAKLEHPAKKSELLRAGLKALSAMKDADLLSALGAVPPVKTGRPKGRDKAGTAKH
jgi:hypothetical protein